MCFQQRTYSQNKWEKKKKQQPLNPFEIANSTIEKLNKKLGQELHKEDIQIVNKQMKGTRLH